MILLGRNEEKLRRVAQHIADEQHVQPQWFTLDLLTCTAEECRQVADRIAAHYWQDVMQVNVNATFMLTQALLPLLLKSDAGSLVFTSSSVGRQGRANWGAYATSKFATEGMNILDLADTVSELRPVKHAFDAGVKAQMGIDY